MFDNWASCVFKLVVKFVAVDVVAKHEVVGLRPGFEKMFLSGISKEKKSKLRSVSLGIHS